MKKHFFYILAVLMLVLAACAQENSKEETNDHGSTKEEQENEQSNNESIEVNADESAEDLEQNENLEEATGPLYQLNSVTWAFEPIGDANPKSVLLTIDDAPDKRALDMAKTLKELDAPAIFFVNGHFLNADEDKAVLKEIHNMGFAIGNHTQTHANLQAISEDEQKEEILKVSDMVEEVIGERPKFFRAPFGQNTDYSKQVVAEDGMLLMNWTFGYDWEKQYMDAGALADIMVNTEFMRDGANLLMHDRDWTADALKEIVEGLRAKGYDFIDPDTIKGVNS